MSPSLHLGALATSVIFFLAGRRHPMRVRLIKSAHGLLFFVAVVYADVASRFTAFDDYGYWVVPFIFILLMAVVSMLASLVDEYVHKSLWGLHLFTVYYGAIVGLFGLLTIAHDYL